MRLATVIVLCSLFLGVSGDGWYSFFREAVQGTWDLWRAYRDNLEANYQNADQYFYARGNYEAQQRGSGGIWAAKIIRMAKTSESPNWPHFWKCLDGAIWGKKMYMKEKLSSEREIMGKWDYARSNRDCSISGVTVYIDILGHISSAKDRSHSPGVPEGARSTSRMKPSIAIILCILILGVDSQRWVQFMKEAGQGSRDMWRAYSDMKKANWKNSDKYFHARGNYDAARRGPGGAWAAKVISDAREAVQKFTGHGAEDSRADQFANEWGRSGKDPNHFRPAGLPKRY